jgi:hypothetical protein
MYLMWIATGMLTVNLVAVVALYFMDNDDD